jgi:hypothetical protein
MRDWVLWFDAEGPDGLVNGKAPGVCVVKTPAIMSPSVCYVYH